MPPNAAFPSSRLWGLRASLTGIIACGLGAAICTTRYLAQPGAERLNWSCMPLAIALFAVIGGTSVGIGIGGTTLLAARRQAGQLGMIVAGAIGGILAGITPGILGIAGFGSLSAPYAGTFNILSAVLVGVVTFVGLWAPQLRPSSGPCTARSMARHLGQATLASLIPLGALGMMAWSIATTLEVIPSFDAMSRFAAEVGLLPVAIGGGALLGAIAGAAIGGACALVLQMRRH